MPVTEEFVSHSAEETIGIGRELARRLVPPRLVLLSGDLARAGLLAMRVDVGDSTDDRDV